MVGQPQGRYNLYRIKERWRKQKPLWCKPTGIRNNWVDSVYKHT